MYVFPTKFKEHKLFFMQVPYKNSNHTNSRHPNGVCACSKDHEETSSIKSSPFPLSLCVLAEVNLLQFHVCISSKI
jgi:hypothetical protein